MYCDFEALCGVDERFDEGCALVEQLSRMLKVRYAGMKDLGYPDYHARMIYDPVTGRDLLNVPYLTG